MRNRILLMLTLAAVAMPAVAGDRIPIADEGKIGDRWTLVPGSQLVPPYPPAYARNPEQVCLVVGYLVNANGTTSDFSLLKSWASGDNARGRTDFWERFGDLASRALAQWRYAPRDAASAEPVYTAATFVFGAPGEIAATREHCAIPDGLAGEKHVHLIIEDNGGEDVRWEHLIYAVFRRLACLTHLRAVHRTGTVESYTDVQFRAFRFADVDIRRSEPY